MNSQSDLQKTKMDVFWGEMAPVEHCVQIYESDDIFLKALDGFVMGGFRAGESVIVIATQAHLNGLEDQLRNHSIDVEGAIWREQYIPLDAEETLSKFMVNGWPDDERFAQVINKLITHARRQGRQVRAFGEMVALLWVQGHNGATVRLEHLWNEFCEEKAFCLFCAYPRSGFTQDAQASIQELCSKHSRVFEGSYAA